MACNCIEEWNKLLKERLNHTATVNHDIISGRVVINGIYHKLKKDGSYNPNKWNEVNLWPKYCPFCGKPYDIKDIYGKEAVEIRDGLICTHVELHNWEYDDNDQKRPTCYLLSFRFHGVECSGQLSVSNLMDNDITFGIVECDGDLLASFMEVFEQNDLSQPIADLCRKCWEEEGKDSEYDFCGLRD